MRHRRNARGFQVMAAMLVLASLTDPAPSATPADTPGDAMRIVKVGDVAFELVRIPAGRFNMGSLSGDRDARPVHEVSIANDFYLGKTEVTFRQFRAFVEATGYKTDAEQAGWANTCPLPGLHPHQRGLDWRRPGFEPGDDHPAVVVSRNDATAFCRWLSERTGRTFRLPTEAEWEYAARAGRQDDFVDPLDPVAWYEGNASDRTHAVGTKTANPWGLHDVQGNVWEWCLDVWRQDYRDVPTDGSAWRHDPVVPEVTWRYVLRGGSWASRVRQLSPSYRARPMKDFRRPDTGLRIVLSTADANQTSGPAFDIRDVRFELVRIPAGRFAMGSDSGRPDEKPMHMVRIGHDLEMGRTEVTVAQFRAFVEATGYRTQAQKDGGSHICNPKGQGPFVAGSCWRQPGYAQSDHHPVVCVSWHDAVAFCRWLSDQTGREFRLPTEAEWEYACRTDIADIDSDRMQEQAWFRPNAGGEPHRVAGRKPNRWGLYDLPGNVSEWCLDLYHKSYSQAPADGSAWLGEGDDYGYYPGENRVVRGATWITDDATKLRPAFRRALPPVMHDNLVGFRIVRAAPREGDAGGAVAGEKGPTAPAREETRGQSTCISDNATGRTILTAHGARFEFVRVPAGEFMMGLDQGEIERPVHRVRIGYDFEMGRTEVTVAQFRAFVKATGYMTNGEKEGFGATRRGEQDWQSEEEVDWCHTTSDQSDDHPAIFISWYDAMAFCHWLSIESGQEIRLPSEAEWEHACRAGTTGLYAGELNAMGWYHYNACNRTHPVAQK